MRGSGRGGRENRSGACNASPDGLSAAASGASSRVIRSRRFGYFLKCYPLLP
jgi:hypothetical protein